MQLKKKHVRAKRVRETEPNICIVIKLQLSLVERSDKTRLSVATDVREMVKNLLLTKMFFFNRFFV